MIEEVKARIKIYESYGEHPYLCPRKKWTIGYGHNYQERGLPKPFLKELLVNVFGAEAAETKLSQKFTTDILTGLLQKGFNKDMAERLLDADVQIVIDELKNYAWFDKLDEVRRATLVDMDFQMGINKFKGFKKMVKALETRDYATAAIEAKDSAWYTQSGHRAIINVAQLKTGQWQKYK